MKRHEDGFDGSVLVCGLYVSGHQRTRQIPAPGSLINIIIRLNPSGMQRSRNDLSWLSPQELRLYRFRQKLEHEPDLWVSFGLIEGDCPCSASGIDLGMSFHCTSSASPSCSLAKVKQNSLNNVQELSSRTRDRRRFTDAAFTFCWILSGRNVSTKIVSRQSVGRAVDLPLSLISIGPHSHTPEFDASLHNRAQTKRTRPPIAKDLRRQSGVAESS